MMHEVDEQMQHVYLLYRELVMVAQSWWLLMGSVMYRPKVYTLCLSFGMNSVLLRGNGGKSSRFLSVFWNSSHVDLGASWVAGPKSAASETSLRYFVQVETEARFSIHPNSTTACGASTRSTHKIRPQTLHRCTFYLIRSHFMIV